MNTKALRQKILDLAIHGKLVPQDPNDEPASVLLERIKAEKERLIKEGKIKRTKRSKAACDKPHYENEEPFDIPSSWVWTTINDINMYNSKNVDPAKHKENIFELYSVPVFPTDTPEIVKGEKIGSAKQSVENGDVLLCKINPKINRVWFVKNRTENAMIASSEWIVVRNKFMLTDYLVFCFMSPYFRDLIENNVSGVGGSLTRAQPSMVATYTIPIPPFHEQERIVEEIKHWFELIDVIEHSKEDLQEVIKQTKSKILNLAIHGKLVPQDPNDEPARELLKRINPKAEITCDNPQYENLPNGWCRCTLKDIGIFESGYAFSSDEYKQNGVPLVRISNITNNGNIDLSSCVYIQNYNNSKFIIHEGDLLIAMSGATTGKMGVYKYKTDALLNQRVGNLKCTEAWLQQYRNYFMLAKSNYILNIAYGGAQPNISAKAILSIKIDLPPINEQHRIVAKIEELFAQLDNITSSL